MKRPISHVVGAIATVSVLGFMIGLAGCARFSNDDEAPIIVRNGSMHIETTDGNWTQEGSDWSNETPAGKVHDNDLWVAVVSTTGSKCTAPAPGHPVIIRYSAPGVQAHFNPGGNPIRTKVKLTGQWNRDDDHRLSHGSAGDGGHISEVRVGGTLLACDLTASNLRAINICSSADVTACR